MTFIIKNIVVFALGHAFPLIHRHTEYELSSIHSIIFKADRNWGDATS